MTTCTPLIQIRSVFRAEWESLAFSVESGSDEWTLRVEESTTHRVLYTARRAAAAAAKVAAAEYGISLVQGFASRITPQNLARDLSWQRSY
jgi:hypothetical protein